jgi:phosphate starvation-inducible protein PhoH and related proteins
MPKRKRPTVKTKATKSTKLRPAKSTKTKDRTLLHSIKPKTPGQATYLQTIEDKTVTICNGLAGTGKTFISFGCALKHFVDASSPISRIIIVRPTFTAGDEPELGYLPGSLNDKMEPFLAPILRDSAPLLIRQLPSTTIGRPYGQQNSNGSYDISTILLKFNIEIVPLHLMRGRTFHKAFVILDEAQNCSMSDFKLFLTRIGKESKVVIEGDASQTDRTNGALPELMGKLDGLDDVGNVVLGAEDIIRNKIISAILERLS